MDQPDVDIEAVIEQSVVCRLITVSGGTPQIALLPFGRRDDTLYFHGSAKSTWMTTLMDDPRVCFEFDLGARIARSDSPCEWDVLYQAVIGTGTASLIDDPDEKRAAFAVIMSTYADESFEFPEGEVMTTSVVKIDIESMAGMHS